MSIAGLIRHAVAASPYYRETLGAGAEDAALADLPTLSKATLMAEFDRIVTDPRLRLGELEAHAASPRAGEAFLGSYRVFATSGSSGQPGIVVFSEEEFARWVARHVPVLAALGLRPGTRIAAIGAPGAVHLSKQLFAALQPPGAAPSRLSVVTPISEQVATLNAMQPGALLGYASAIAALAQEQLDGRLGIAPRTVVTGAEVLTVEMQRSISEAFGVEPGQIYATTEVPIVAAGPTGALAVPDDVVVVEVVDAANRPVAPGTPGERVLVTNLVNRAQPLIRYELSDAVTLAPDGLIASIDGRSDDVIELPGRDGALCAVHPYRLRAPFATLPDVARYQVVHDGSVVDVRVVLRPGAAAATPAAVEHALRTALEEAGALPPPLRVDVVDAIEREPGHAAKLKLVKRR